MLTRPNQSHEWLRLSLLRFAAILLTAAMLFSLAACDESSSSKDEDDDDEKAQKEEDKKKDNDDSGVNLGGLQLPGVDQLPKDLNKIDLSKLNDPKEVIRIAFEKGHAGSREMDNLVQATYPLTLKDKVDTGADMYRMLKQEGKIPRDSSHQERLERLLKPILEKHVKQATDINFTISVMEDPLPNAFAHIGGYVYATTGLLELLNDDELAYVVGHEVGHVELDHVNRPWVYVKLARDFKGGPNAQKFVMIAYKQIANGFNEDQELDADDWGFVAARIEGHPGQAAITAQQKMAEWYRKHEPGYAKTPAEPTSIFEALSQAINDHARTHPPTEERIERFKQLEQHLQASGQLD